MEKAAGSLSGSDSPAIAAAFAAASGGGADGYGIFHPLPLKIPHIPGRGVRDFPSGAGLGQIAGEASFLPVHDAKGEGLLSGFF